MFVDCPVSLGELIDKITILTIKERKIQDSAKLKNIIKEKDLLQKKLLELNLLGIEVFIDQLIEVNEKLWDIEDEIRQKEFEQDFGKSFIELARSVYKTNDKRFSIKNRINREYDSDIAEEKSYKEYYSVNCL